jgi:hypothetical protein
LAAGLERRFAGGAVDVFALLKEADAWGIAPDLEVPRSALETESCCDERALAFDVARCVKAAGRRLAQVPAVVSLLREKEYSDDILVEAAGVVLANAPQAKDS